MWNVERWRMLAVGLYCRWLVRSEDLEATAATLAQVHRLADQIGLSPAGMKENGWRLAVDEVTAKREVTPTTKTTSKARPGMPPVRRLRAASE